MNTKTGLKYFRWTALGFAGVTLASVGYINAQPIDVTNEPLPPGYNHQVTRTERLIAKHGCWTGEAPADVTYPGGVVFTNTNTTTNNTTTDHFKAVYSHDPLVVDRALQQVFSDADYHMNVHAFCK